MRAICLPFATGMMPAITGTVTPRVREKTGKETKNGGGVPPVNPSRR